MLFLVPLNKLRETLTKPEWASGRLFFIGDVGGTNARLGFAARQPDDGVAIAFVHFIMDRRDISQLSEFFAQILRVLDDSIISRVHAGVLSLPGPVTEGQIGGPFNNLKGVSRLSDYPKELFPPGRSALLNDLEAGGYGVVAASEARLFPEYFKLMWEGTLWKPSVKKPAGSVLGCGRCFVIAPGTGLGTSLIDYNYLRKCFTVLPLEYGSTSVPCKPGTSNYLNELAEVNGRKQYVPCLEDVVCGHALEFNYKRLIARTQDRKPLLAAEIATKARAGDAIALQAMSTFFEYLMAVASEVGMAFQPLTCIIVGDNIANNSFFCDDEARLKHMKETVLSHPMERFGFLSRVTFVRQVKKLNLNLLGCYGFCTQLGNGDSSPSQPIFSHM